MKAHYSKQDIKLIKHFAISIDIYLKESTQTKFKNFVNTSIIKQIGFFKYHILR